MRLLELRWVERGTITVASIMHAHAIYEQREGIKGTSPAKVAGMHEKPPIQA
jgi:hypothetical protein